jgi:thiamine biosynthesis protein ThiS
VSNTETDQIAIVVNGVTRNVPGGLSLIELLGHLGIEPDRIAIELDGGIVRKPAWAATSVESGAKLEIVQFVGGG